MDALRSVTIFTLAAGLWLCGSPALAQQPVLDSVPSLEVVRRQLDLTDEQYAKLEPIFRQRLAELQTLNTKLQQSASDQERRKVLSDARHGASTFNSQVVRVLSSSQKNAWRKLRDEARKKVD